MKLLQQPGPATLEWARKGSFNMGGRTNGLWLAALSVVLVLATGTASAHESNDSTRLIVPYAYANATYIDAESGDTQVLGSEIGPLTIFADGAECGSLSLTEPAVTTDERSHPVFVLGNDDQPEQCSTDGATLTFATSSGADLMHERMLNQREDMYVTELLEQQPPPPDEAVAQVVVPAWQIDKPYDAPYNPTGAETVGEVVGGLDVMADGKECGELSFTGSEQRNAQHHARFLLGTDGQPSACAEEGATITFVSRASDERGQDLGKEFRLETGATLALYGLAPPADSGGNGSVAVAPPEAGSGTVGDGHNTSSDAPGTWVAFGLVACIVAALGLAAVSRQPGRGK